MILTNKEIFLLTTVLGCFVLSARGDALSCFTVLSSKICNVLSNDSILVKEEITSESMGTFSSMHLSILTEAEGVTLNISLGDNIQGLSIQNSGQITCYVETYTVNTNLKKIVLTAQSIAINDRDFFAYFPNLEDFDANVFKCKSIPHFTKNKQLTSIKVSSSIIEDVSSRFIDPSMVGGLDKLVHLQWKDSGITEIKPGSFEGVIGLTQLVLIANHINTLHSCTFEGLVNLHSISLQGNSIVSVDSNAFLGLESVVELNLENNPNMSLTSITSMKKLEQINLSGNNPENISPEILQQFPKLATVILDSIRFNCSCDSQWIKELTSFWISTHLTGSSCIHDSTKQVDNPTLYTDCVDRGYQCFNKSIECTGDFWSRVESNNGCDCIYPNNIYNASVICSDIDECQHSGICEGNCTNTPGSYMCNCFDGFFNVNEITCSDIDECAMANCSHSCTNTPGSYYCTCLPGYTKQGFTNCSDFNECESMNGNCSHNCTNTIGSYECSCLPGYMKQGLTECVDINECSVSNGNCPHNCTNYAGSFNCSCFTGYIKQQLTQCEDKNKCIQLPSCVDIDECNTANGNCSHNCTNTIGSYECSCFPGYMNQGLTECVDINECVSGNGNCTQNCINTNGSFECSCQSGYIKLGFSSCIDFNECELSDRNCSHNCTNIPGSYFCSCLQGYMIEGLTECVDINECDISNGNCSHTCTNTLGLYECSCFPGYIKQGSTECILIDECSINNGGCHHMCNKINDGHSCSCFEGYKTASLNSSHCESNLNGGAGEQNSYQKDFVFYILLSFSLLFLITVIILCIMVIFVYCYFRRQLQSWKSTPSSKVNNVYQEPTLVESSIPMSNEKKEETGALNDKENGLTFKNSIEETPV